MLYDDAVRVKKAASKAGKNAAYPELRIRKIVRRFR